MLLAVGPCGAWYTLTARGAAPGHGPDVSAAALVSLPSIVHATRATEEEVAKSQSGSVRSRSGSLQPDGMLLMPTFTSSRCSITTTSRPNGCSTGK